MKIWGFTNLNNLIIYLINAFSINFVPGISTKFLFKFLQDITIEGYYVLKNFYQNFVYSIKLKKMPCRFANISTIYWRVVSYLELSFITLFHHCLWTANNTIYLCCSFMLDRKWQNVFDFQVSVGQWLTKVFFSILDWILFLPHFFWNMNFSAKYPFFILWWGVQYSF